MNYINGRLKILISNIHKLITLQYTIIFSLLFRHLMEKLVITLLLLSVVYATQYVTIPKREVGILDGSSDAAVKIELIYDPVCGDTAQFDGLFRQVLQSLSQDIKSKVSVRYISLSLPHHIASQKLTQGIIYVLQNKGSKEALSLMRDFLLNRQKWDEQNIGNQTIRGLMIRISQKINVMFGLKTQQVLKQLAHGSRYDGKVRQWSKVAMGSMKAAGTPRMRINGVTVDGASDMSSRQISDLIKSLFTTTQQEYILRG